MLVAGHAGAGDQLAHQSSGRSAVGLDQRRFFRGTFCIVERTVDDVEGVPQLVQVLLSGLRIRDAELDDWRWIDHPTISFAEPTGSCGDGLLSNSQFIFEWSPDTDQLFIQPILAAFDNLLLAYHRRWGWWHCHDWLWGGGDRLRIRRPVH